MGGYFRAVRPMSLSAIESAATQLRKLLRLEPDARVQMVNLIETVLDEVLPDYLFCVMPDEDMPGMDGITAVGSFTICLSEHTYVDLCQGMPEARLTAAHELGHLILHSQQQPALARRTFNDDRVDPEWQADRFAEFWLMPTFGVGQCQSAQEVADRFSVPLEAAVRRYAQLSLKAGDGVQGELF
ncbi:MAG: ImmA/IrrE family metallo-endopeptidase [Sphingomonas sp.]